MNSYYMIIAAISVPERDKIKRKNENMNSVPGYPRLSKFLAASMFFWYSSDNHAGIKEIYIKS